MFKRIDHVEIIPENFDKTYAFYTEILGFKEKSRMDINRPPMKGIVFIELGDSVIEILNIENPPVPPRQPMQAGYVRIALEVEDMAKAVEYLKGKGVDITREPVDVGGSLRGEIADPDGLSIELRQW